MQKRMTTHAVEATQVWGIEVMDPLEQRAWAHNLWQRLLNSNSQRPLLLSYSLAAERGARRTLTALAQIAREAGWAVHYFAPEGLPLLPRINPFPPSLLLVHHGSRFVNVNEWLTAVTATPSCRTVLTVPTAEITFLTNSTLEECVPVPEEEPEYCESQAQKIAEKFFVDATPLPPALKNLEPILLEAGAAEIPLPLDLLARHFHLSPFALMENMHTSRWRHFIWYPAATADMPAAVALRGRWLAEKMLTTTSSSSFSHLVDLLQEINPHSPDERFFFLNLLVSLHRRGKFIRLARLLRDHDELVHRAAAAAEPAEREAWNFFCLASLRPVVPL